MVKTVKCGDYMIKDGIPFYRPGKKFVVVDMPKTFLKTCPKEFETSPSIYEDVEQMNALQNIEWKKKRIEQHRQMARMFAKKVLLHRPIKRVGCAISRLKTKLLMKKVKSR